jgi:hypothetical protein
MNILFWGLTLGVVGKVLVVLAVLHMHHSLVREHRIDRSVILTYKQERFLTFIGLILITVGYILEIMFYSPTPLFLCHGSECAAALGAAFGSQ